MQSVPGNEPIGKFKLRGVYSLQSDGAGNINAGFRLTQPDSFDGAGAVLTDWTSVSNLYDQFMVTGISLKYVPTHPNDSTTTVAYRPVYVYPDFDAVGLSLTDAAAVGYANVKIHNLYRPWKYYVKVPPLVNTASTSVNMVGWMDTAAPQVTGSLYVSKATGLTNSTLYGIIVLTYYIKAIVRK